MEKGGVFAYVIRREKDQRVVGNTVALERAEHLADCPVHLPKVVAPDAVARGVGPRWTAEHRNCAGQRERGRWGAMGYSVSCAWHERFIAVVERGQTKAATRQRTVHMGEREVKQEGFVLVGGDKSVGFLRKGGCEMGVVDGLLDDCRSLVQEARLRPWRCHVAAALVARPVVGKRDEVPDVVKAVVGREMRAVGSVVRVDAEVPLSNQPRCVCVRNREHSGFRQHGRPRCGEAGGEGRGGAWRRHSQPSALTASAMVVSLAATRP